VNRVGFGALRLAGRVPFGNGAPENFDQAIRVLRRAVELGVNHFDTAAFYRSDLHGANEMIRAALWPYAENIVIATKLRPDRYQGGPSLGDQIKENLRELRLDCLDLVYLRVMAGSSFAEDFGTLSGLRDAGVIQHLGLSAVSTAQLDEALAIAPVIAIQNRYGIGVRRDDDMLHTASTRGIAFVPYFSIAAEGKHAGPTEESEVVRDVARNHGVSVAAVRIAWTLELAPNVLAIPGTGNVEHLNENVAAGALRLSTGEMALLGSITHASE